ncbi:MAG: flagellar motor switch protein FliG [Deltaproteobacteria bacterium]|jgi:flagellar motor switch protein FliG|uniref:Flagellar motor switch protein FliG n=1 Tax=Candidatus Acidulodesulfobacterium acidiphilum TaxID=2597224 RepID=A0A520X9Y0_9DELT|nr:flagellar motor switch protein FliG [Deltaproteobacteria bacterium]RZV37968.1 MAG: flagellar motor switch protein FliG [Candidatus Acidulodesulfobacterium acidiphilum]
MARRLSGPEKAAVFLVSVGEDAASEIIKRLELMEIQKITKYMDNLPTIEKEESENILKDFNSNFSKVGLIVRGDDYVKNLIAKSLDPDKAKKILDNLHGPIEEEGLQTLKWLDPHVIADFVKNEHPQTIALILGHLESLSAAVVIGLLPSSIRSQVVFRLSKLERVPPGVIKDLDEVLQEQLKSTGSTQSKLVGGVRVVADILNNMDKSIEEPILADIEKLDKEEAEKIRELMFTFDDLASVDDKSMQLILREVSHDQIVLALKTASEELNNKILANVSKRAQEMIKDDLEAMGPKKLSEVEKVQHEILKVARRLEDEGKISLAVKSESEKLV